MVGCVFGSAVRSGGIGHALGGGWWGARDAWWAEAIGSKMSRVSADMATVYFRGENPELAAGTLLLLMRLYPDAFSDVVRGADAMRLAKVLGEVVTMYGGEALCEIPDASAPEMMAYWWAEGGRSRRLMEERLRREVADQETGVRFEVSAPRLVRDDAFHREFDCVYAAGIPQMPIPRLPEAGVAAGAARHFVGRFYAGVDLGLPVAEYGEEEIAGRLRELEEVLRRPEGGLRALCRSGACGVPPPGLGSLGWWTRAGETASPRAPY